jgi:threonine/homoserine/homoserine lactone efflux protein
MELAVFVKGIVFGLTFCAPVGPIGLLCARRTLVNGRMEGLMSLLGASTVDALYCAVAGLGIARFSDFLNREEPLIRLLAGLVLVLLGVRVFFWAPREKILSPRRRGSLQAFLSTFLIVLTNPIPILIFTAAFTAMGVHGWKTDYASTMSLLWGVFLGSVLWSPLVVSGVGYFRPQLNARQLKGINVIAGVILLGFGSVLGLPALFRLMT